MVYVTHELPEALRLADRIVELTPEHTPARAGPERPRRPSPASGWRAAWATRGSRAGRRGRARRTGQAAP